jgi:alkylated DNA repair protein (DNA oxidative demethylase)
MAGNAAALLKTRGRCRAESRLRGFPSRRLPDQPPDARLSLHQDRDERDFTQPIVSVSLGLPATFLWGGKKRSDRPRRLPLQNGDVIVWGGPERLNFHGIHSVAEGEHPLTGGYRFNLTFRRAL